MHTNSAKAASPRRHKNQELAIWQSGSRSILRVLLKKRAFFATIGCLLADLSRFPSPTSIHSGAWGANVG